MPSTLYLGASAFGGRVAVVASDDSKNTKTGSCVQVSYLDPRPWDQAFKSKASCGTCPLLKTGCYAWGASSMAWASSHKALLKRIVEDKGIQQIEDAVAGRFVRIGAVGDPGTAPKVSVEIAQASDGWTSYTHAWKSPLAKALKAISMASVERRRDRDKAWAEGWRTFRVARRDDKRLDKGEIWCPSSETLHCVDCGLCSGTAVGRHGPRGIVIPAHGPGKTQAEKICD